MCQAGLVPTHMMFRPEYARLYLSVTVLLMDINQPQLLRYLPFYGALLPLLTFNVCYLVAAVLDHVPICIPYLEGCTSVSSTGRAAPESLIFKAGMFLSAAVLGLLWLRTSTFLRANGVTLFRVNVLRATATLAVVSLVIYAATLGMQEAEYRALRRIGINGFALGNMLTSIIFLVLYRPLRTSATDTAFRWLVGVCIGLPLLGVFAEIAKSLGLPRRPVNNAAAWNASLLIAAYYAAFTRIWLHELINTDRPVRSDG